MVEPDNPNPTVPSETVPPSQLAAEATATADQSQTPQADQAEAAGTATPIPTSGPAPSSGDAKTGSQGAKPPGSEASQKRDSDSQPTVESIYALFGQLNPGNQLNRVMLRAGMQQDFWPPDTLDLAQRQDRIMQWAQRGGYLPKLHGALKDVIRIQSREPQAVVRDAIPDLGWDHEAEPCLEALAPSAGDTFHLEEQTSKWASRLHSQRLLVVSCPDPKLLSAIARTLPFHQIFESAEKLQISRRSSPTIGQVVESQRSTSAVVVAYAIGDFGERWMREFPTEQFFLDGLLSDLKRAMTWLLCLTNPETTEKARFRLRGAFVEQVDFIGPRLRSALGSGWEDLASKFMRQRSKGYWGQTDKETLQLLDDAVENEELKDRIEAEERRGPGAIPQRQTPDWKALLAAADVLDRVLYELLLFVGAFFCGPNDREEDGQAVAQFDALIRKLIPIAAPDGGIATTPDGQTAAEQLAQAWLSRGGQLRAACGLRTVRSDSRGMIIRFAASDWRDELVKVFSSETGYWVFSRLARYVRRRDFVFGPEDWAGGAAQVAVAQAMLNPRNDPAELLGWILACAGPGGAGLSEGISASAEALGSLSPEDRQVLGFWTAQVLCALQSGTATSAFLGNLINLRAHQLAAATLLRLWGKAEYVDACLAVARRLLSEAPGEIKEAVLVQMRAAVRRGDLRLYEIWKRQWLPPDQSDPGPPGRAAARLLVALLEASIGGVRSDQLFRRFAPNESGSPDWLVAWLWHPEVDKIIADRPTTVAALPGLWMLPEAYRRLALAGRWEPANAFLTLWWLGFLLAAIDADNPVENPLPLVFRAMAVTNWMTTVSEAEVPSDLSAAIARFLKPSALRTFRACLYWCDVGLGDVLQAILGGTMVAPPERRDVQIRIKQLRDCLRNIRRAAVPAVAGV